MKVPLARTVTFTNSSTGSVFTVAQIRDMLDRIYEEGRGLTVWETSFIANLANQFERTNSLSEPQLIALENVYTNRTA